MKTARRRAREIALQSLYAWQVAGGEASEVIDQARSMDDWNSCDAAFAEALMRGVMGRARELESLLAPCLDARTFAELSPVERAVLYIGSFELAAHPETPFKVVLNEAIELGKSFGGTDGHRFINGVLEKLAGGLREQELARHRRSA